MRTGSRVTGERFFTITQKGKFCTNNLKRGILPKHYFSTMQNKIFYISILTNALLVRRMRVFTSGFR